MTPITIEQALTDTSASLWVVNVSEAVSEDGVRDDIFMSVRIDQEEIALPIIATWIPQDVGTLVPKENILKSSRFRTALNRGVLRLISPSEADRTLAHPAAVAERARLDDVMSLIRDSSAAKKLDVKVIKPTVVRKETTLSGSTSAPADLAMSDASLNTSDLSMPEEETLLSKLNDLPDDATAAAYLKSLGTVKKNDLIAVISRLKHQRLAAALRKQLGS